MRNFQTFWRRILLPPPSILTVFILLAVIFLLPLPLFDTASFRALSVVLGCYVLLSLSLRLPHLYRICRDTLLRQKQHPERAEWWARAGLFGGLLLNLIYAFFRMTIGIRTGSLWFCTEAIYYAVLCAIRFTLVEEDRRIPAEQDERQRRLHAMQCYRRGGLSLLLLSLSVAGTVALAMRQNRIYPYSDLIIAATVGFTLWRVISAAFHLLRFRRRRRPIPLLSKAVSLSAALVSLFGLQSTLLARFGKDATHRAAWNGATGLFVCIFLTVMALFILRKAQKAQKSR